MQPQTKNCQNCKHDFQITTEDFSFYEKMQVPAPTLCPDCRRRRRYAHQNMIKLYKRRCGVLGHSEDIVTTVSPSTVLTVYDYSYYHSDAWNPMDYHLDVTPGVSFFSQFAKLSSRIPHPSLRRGPESVNAEFSFNGGKSKSLYYCSSIWDSEDVMYSFQGYKMVDCMDCYYSEKISSCYQCVRTFSSYDVLYAYFSNDCTRSRFMYNCRNCTECFGCVNLRNKKYCYFNTQLTKEEYEKKIGEHDLGSRTVVEETHAKFWDLVKSLPFSGVHIERSENATGDNIKNSKDVVSSYFIDSSENVRYSDSVTHVTDIMDVSLCGKSDFIYESIASGGGSSNLKFCIAAKQCRDSEYLLNCNNCVSCFGCIGLKNKSYCIFNKQYNEKTYGALVASIKEEMIAQGEYGEFFPETSSIYAYNSSYAGTLYPETKEKVLSWGGTWQEEVLASSGSFERLEASEAPDNIADIGDEILSVAIVDTEGHPFRIVPGELAFYTRKGLPIPTTSPYRRIEQRLSYVNYLQVKKDTCARCGREVQTTFTKKDGYLPYCESCYQEEVL